ncbi:MAG: metal-dependent hydrolase [Gemmatimonadaceae bacterium]
MDPITHTMAGAAMGRAGLDRRTPLAGVTLMLAANAPDIDIFSLWLGTYASLAFRRGWTHGPLALVVLAVALTGLVLGWDRLVRRRRDPSLAPVDARWTFILATAGVVSHPLLDLLNTYGIRLLMPFSGRWFYADAVFIIDPWIWLMLGAALILARRGAVLRTVQRVAGLAVAYVLVLLGLSAVGERMALSAAGSQGIGDVLEVLYQPSPTNPFAAQLIAVTADGYHVGALSWLAADRIRFEGEVIRRGDWADPRIARAVVHPDVRNYLVWSRYPWARIETTAAGVPATVVFGDARFPSGGMSGGLGGVRVSDSPPLSR